MLEGAKKYFSTSHCTIEDDICGETKKIQPGTKDVMSNSNFLGDNIIGTPILKGTKFSQFSMLEGAQNIFLHFIVP